jgi:hypothetical protein
MTAFIASVTHFVHRTLRHAAATGLEPALLPKVADKASEKASDGILLRD